MTGRKPVPHEHRADHADQCSGDHVTRVMGEQNKTARGDHNGIDEHDHARPRPHRRHRESQRKRGSSVARWKARIGFGAGKVREVKGIGLAADERPSAADHVLDDLAHHPSDVVAGALLGMIGAMLVRYWFAARHLAFTIRSDGAILPLAGPSPGHLKRVARGAFAP